MAKKKSAKAKARKAKTYDGLWRAKWTTDGAKTLEEAASMLEEAAKGLRAMARDGVELRQPVEDDYGFFETTDPSVAKKHGMREMEVEEEEEEEEGAEA